MGCTALANDPGRLLNLSNRAWVGTGHERLIGSAITTGDLPMEVLVVVRGPSLANTLRDAGYTGNVLADPVVTFIEIPLSLGGIQISNDNFGDWNNGEIQTRFPGFIQNPNESGLIAELPPKKSFSAIVEGVGGGTGLAQIEFYEITPKPPDLTGVYLQESFGSRHEVIINDKLIFGLGLEASPPASGRLFAGLHTISGQEIFGEIAGVRLDLIESGFVSPMIGSFVEGKSIEFSFVDDEGLWTQFDVEYPKELNNTPSSLSMCEGRWIARDGQGRIESIITINLNGEITDEDPDGCEVTGQIGLIDPNRNLYALSYVLTGACFPSPGQYVGFGFLYKCDENNECSEIRFQASGGDKVEEGLLAFTAGTFNRDPG